jgi:hypothetical protein
VPEELHGEDLLNPPYELHATAFPIEMPEGSLETAAAGLEAGHGESEMSEEGWPGMSAVKKPLGNEDQGGFTSR